MGKRMVQIATLAFLSAVGGVRPGPQPPAGREGSVAAARALLGVTGLAAQRIAGPGVGETAARVAAGVGVVASTWSKGALPPVFVFEEYHNSRIGQIEIAVMLLRLRELGVTSVGLEGAYQSPVPLDARWFHPLGGSAAAGRREDVAVRMLAEGEISSAEALALVFPDEEVYGTEIPALYDHDSRPQRNPELGYLISIAQPHLTPADIARANSLAASGRTREALEVVVGADPWTRARYDTLRAAAADSAVGPSCETMERRLQAIRAEAEHRGVSVERGMRAEADSAAVFYRTCQERSSAIVGRVAEHSRQAGGPTAMVIGAAHGEGVVRLLRARGIPYAVIRPIALHPAAGSLTDEQYERKNGRLWARTSPGTLGALLNAGGTVPQHKPSPIIETATAHGYASLMLAGMLVAEAARAGRPLPGDVWSELRDLPDCDVDATSFTVDGYDVVFAATLEKTDGSDVVVWSRVGTVDAAQTDGLLPKLLKARDDLSGGGGAPPTGFDPVNDEGPGDGTRDGFVVERTSPNTLAIFAATQEVAMDVGRLSA